MITSKSVGHSRNTNNVKQNRPTLYGNNSCKSKVSTTYSQPKLYKSDVSTNCKLPFNCVYKGKTDKFHENRRESFLNSQYNKRRNQLLEITKVNRKIFERINSLQSFYVQIYSHKKTKKKMLNNCTQIDKRSQKNHSIIDRVTLVSGKSTALQRRVENQRRFTVKHIF